MNRIATQLIAESTLDGAQSDAVGPQPPCSLSPDGVLVTTPKTCPVSDEGDLLSRREVWWSQRESNPCLQGSNLGPIGLESRWVEQRLQVPREDLLPIEVLAAAAKGE